MKELFCQSCGMPMNSEELLGTNSDGSKNNEYCTHCYQVGEFTTPNRTMEEMIEICVPFLIEDGTSEDKARKLLNATLPNLKRWR